jgi:hypothetical protein
LSVNVVEVKDSVHKCDIILTDLHLKIKNTIIERSRANNIYKLVTPVLFKFDVCWVICFLSGGSLSHYHHMGDLFSIWRRTISLPSYG